MPTTFHYKGRDSSGRITVGTLTVNKIDDVIFYLKKRNIIPINIKPIKNRTIKLRNLLSLELGKTAVDMRDIMNFCRQLAALNGAGVPLIKAINQLAQSSDSHLLSTTLTAVANDISAGLSLGNALKKHPTAFSAVVVNIANIGESTGHLNEALIQLGNYLESTIANHRRLLSAVRYPFFVIITTLVAMLILNFFVIPRFAMIFSSFKIELPIFTRIIMASSNFLNDNWIILLIAIICLFLIGYKLLKTPAIRYSWDQYKLSMPIFGNLQKRIILSQFTWTFSLILRSGVPIIKGIALASIATKNSYFKKQLLVISDAIEQGESFSQAAEISGLFTPITIQMIAVGEESGKLDELLGEVAKYYDTEVDYNLRQLNELIEPILLTIIGSMVLVLALGIYLPMWDMIKAIQ